MGVRITGIGNLQCLTNLQNLNLYDNSLSSVDVSGLNSLSYLNIESNQLTSSSIDDILITVNGFDTSNGNLQLGGLGNGVPGSSGLSAKDSLESRDWIVGVNV